MKDEDIKLPEMPESALAERGAIWNAIYEFGNGGVSYEVDAAITALVHEQCRAAVRLNKDAWEAAHTENMSRVSDLNQDDIKLPEVPSLVRCEDWYNAIRNFGIAAVKMNQADDNREYQGKAWRAITHTMVDLKMIHGMYSEEISQDQMIEIACKAVRDLHAKANAATEEKPRPFDLEAAKAGAKLVTGDGRAVRFVAHIPESQADMRVFAHIEGDMFARNFTEDGKNFTLHLFLAPAEPVAPRVMWMVETPSGNRCLYNSEKESRGTPLASLRTVKVEIREVE